MLSDFCCASSVFPVALVSLIIVVTDCDKWGGHKQFVGARAPFDEIVLCHGIAADE